MEVDDVCWVLFEELFEGIGGVETLHATVAHAILLGGGRTCSSLVADVHDNRKVGHANPEGVRSCCPSVIGVLWEVLEKDLPLLEVALDGDV